MVEKNTKPSFFYPLPTLLDGVASIFDLSGKYFNLSSRQNLSDITAFHSDIISLRNDAKIAYTGTLANYVKSI